MTPSSDVVHKFKLNPIPDDAVQRPSQQAPQYFSDGGTNADSARSVRCMDGRIDAIEASHQNLRSGQEDIAQRLNQLVCLLQPRLPSPPCPTLPERGNLENELERRHGHAPCKLPEPLHPPTSQPYSTGPTGGDTEESQSNRAPSSCPSTTVEPLPEGSDGAGSKGRRYFVTSAFRGHLVAWLRTHYKARERFVFDNKAPFTGSNESLAKAFLDTLKDRVKPNTRTVFNQVKLLKDTYADVVEQEKQNPDTAIRPPWFQSWDAMIRQGSRPPCLDDPVKLEDDRVQKRPWVEDQETCVSPVTKRSRCNSDGSQSTSSGQAGSSPRITASSPETVRSLMSTVAQWVQGNQGTDMVGQATESSQKPNTEMLETLRAMQDTQLRLLEEMQQMRAALSERTVTQP